MSWLSSALHKAGKSTAKLINWKGTKYLLPGLQQTAILAAHNTGGLYGQYLGETPKQKQHSEEVAQVQAAERAIGPTPTVETGEDPLDLLRKRKRRASGRQQTILTGDLVPMDIGKRTLLG